MENEGAPERGKLYLCGTPIGNLEDMTFRAVRVLKEADLIAAEDTRHTKKLLNHFKIDTPLTSYHEHNKRTKGPKLIAAIKEGKNVALVSDAGMPGISDPGQELVASAVLENLQVVPVPGPSAVITGLVASGLPAGRFAFEGFWPRLKKEKARLLRQLAEEKRTIIFYESPHRIVATLQDLQAFSGSRQVVISRELTKINEEFLRGTVAEVLECLLKKEPRGEFTVILEGQKENADAKRAGNPGEIAGREQVYDLIKSLVESGKTKKEAMKEVADRMQASRREIYNLVLAAENKK